MTKATLPIYVFTALHFSLLFLRALFPLLEIQFAVGQPRPPRVPHTGLTPRPLLPGLLSCAPCWPVARTGRLCRTAQVCGGRATQVCPRTLGRSPTEWPHKCGPAVRQHMTEFSTSTCRCSWEFQITRRRPLQRLGSLAPEHPVCFAPLRAPLMPRPLRGCTAAGPCPGSGHSCGALSHVPLHPPSSAAGLTFGLSPGHSSLLSAISPLHPGTA